jgi:FkbM family methyltransferase
MTSVSDTTVEITLPGPVVTIRGRREDAYFNSAQHHASGLAALARYVRTSLKPDACVADCGANIGLATLMMSRLLPDGHIYAFEPSPTTAAILRENVALSGFRNIEVVEAALGEVDGTIRFTHAGFFSAGSHVTPDGDIQVPVVSLDSFSEDRGISFDFLKIDVEGYEPWALSGFRRGMRTRPPIWMEYNSYCLNLCGANPFSLAQSLYRTFDVRRVESDGSLFPVADPGTLFRDNITLRGCVDDLVIVLRDGYEMPSLDDLTGRMQDGASA